ncbi:PH domain-containing protein [Tessaracoccus sp. OS52]|uniref:PH domain-containing protein n=1 Tax=Tessaracoccus sp. OS52 TaxID=2886691 RepID=UPI001D11E8BA|nr:PH domain-containing protein [Tessaracoccus sp. OS52]
MQTVSEATPVDPDETPMPAAREVPARLSFTSVTVLLTSVVLSVVLLVSAMWGWYAIGASVRSQITALQAGTLLFFLVFMIGFMLSLGYSRLWADEDGVTIRNGPVLRKFRIDEIAGLRLRQGDAWAYLLIKHDGGVKRRAVLAIQSLEGANAKSKMRQLRHWLKANGANSQGVTLEQEPDQP